MDCITSLQLKPNIANLLAASLLPEENQMTCHLHRLKDDFFITSTHHFPKLISSRKAVKSVNEFEGNEKGQESCFHRLHWDGMSPIILNMLIPMGLEKTKGKGSTADQYTRCPFPVGGLNHRERNSELEHQILNTMFAEDPKLSIVDLFAVMSVSKSPTREMKVDMQQFIIPLQNYQDSLKERLLEGYDDYEKSPEEVVKCFGSYPLGPDPDTNIEIQNMFQCIGLEPKSMNYFTPHSWRGDPLFDDPSTHIHFHVAYFKFLLQTGLIHFTRQDPEEQKHQKNETLSIPKNVDVSKSPKKPNEIIEPKNFNTPVQTMAELARIIRQSGGACFKPFFKCLDIHDPSIREACETRLPLVTHIGKVLLQGRTDIIEQGMEGNHRLAMQAAVLSGSLTASHMKTIANRKLNINLLFTHGLVQQVIPNISCNNELKRHKVGCHIIHFFFCATCANISL